MNEDLSSDAGRSAAQVIPEQLHAQPQYKGVAGWLLLFCVTLTMVNPLAALASFITAYWEAAPYFDAFPRLLTVTLIDMVLSLGLMILSVYAGIILWRVRPGAVQCVKKYLILILVYKAIAAVLPFLAGLPDEADTAMIASVALDAVRGLVFFGVWYSYLNKSERVRATYEFVGQSR
jgi:hypothetical protein